MRCRDELKYITMDNGEQYVEPFFNDIAASVVCRMLGYLYVFCQSLSLPPYTMYNKELRVQAN